jgi:hypothetical protein
MAIKIPKTWPVQPFNLLAGDILSRRATCGACGLSWDDGRSTSMTPTPSGRCPFESFHEAVKVVKFTVTLDINDETAREVADLTHGVDVSLLLRDALGEFVRAREPVETYVARRYASNTDALRRQKVREVTKRLRVAELLHKATVTIEVQS